MKRQDFRIVFRDLRARKRMLLIRTYLIILLTVVFFAAGFCMFTVNASDDVSDSRYKYYTSITIEDDDNLWDICDTYMSEEYPDKGALIDEIIQLNHLSGDDIMSGQSLVIPYYSSEVM